MESISESISNRSDYTMNPFQFNTEMFKNILEFANLYPEEINYDELYSDDDYWLHEYVLEQLDEKLKSLRENVDILCFSFILGM